MPPNRGGLNLCQSNLARYISRDRSYGLWRERWTERGGERDEANNGRESSSSHFPSPAGLSPTPVSGRCTPVRSTLDLLRRPAVLITGIWEAAGRLVGSRDGGSPSRSSNSVSSCSAVTPRRLEGELELAVLEEGSACSNMATVCQSQS